MSELFCRQLIEEMEHFGQWSDGSNYDSRLETGYEAVPTRDIHMRQIDWEEHWLHVLRTYVYPIQVKIYEGYNDKVSYDRVCRLFGNRLTEKSILRRSVRPGRIRSPRPRLER